MAYAASISGRAPSTVPALPRNTLPFADEAGSPGSGSRQRVMRARPMSSIAQPVTGIAPMTPVELSAGVSMRPIGLAPAANAFNVTGTVRGEFGTPGAVIVTVAVRVSPAR